MLKLKITWAEKIKLEIEGKRRKKGRLLIPKYWFGLQMPQTSGATNMAEFDMQWRNWQVHTHTHTHIHNHTHTYTYADTHAPKLTNNKNTYTSFYIGLFLLSYFLFLIL